MTVTLSVRQTVRLQQSERCCWLQGGPLIPGSGPQAKHPGPLLPLCPEKAELVLQACLTLSRPPSVRLIWPEFTLKERREKETRILSSPLRRDGRKKHGSTFRGCQEKPVH
ncbi:hypothetical protein P7K49_021091 [Saguinus oedipus]|uniref:Uncharacterized protein n=1 Tax=Saguinus oedipus TaxID=9490 RepID=A0ABQ9UTC5_SAGOE|nr:hypothetical protein P7K49_021091 [Saguinus oedipus]